MPKKIKDPFIPEVCECCGQSTEVRYGLDKGTADIVKALAVKIREKGENDVHIRDEMEVGTKNFTYMRLCNEGVVTSKMVGNVSRPRYHGLIAWVKFKNPVTGNWDVKEGHYLLTPKGARFLRGEAVPKYAIVNKVTKKKKEYWKPEKYTVTINELYKEDDPYWEGIDYTISEETYRIMQKDQKTEQLF